MTLTYTIATLQAAPSMNFDTETVSGLTYAEAVELAHASYREHGRAVYLYSGKYASGYWYHHVRRDGTCTDRNFSSGVDANGRVAL